MAGTHQIWAYFLSEIKWWKDSVYKPGACAAIVGSGSEENRNNSYPMKAALAQPSGLCVDHKNDVCYIADSESSTIRQLSLKDGQVKGLAGGAVNPKDLFSYGDVDGKSRDAKLQHPLDVCCIPNTEHIVICDSYNHKLKVINTRTKHVTTLPIDGLSEPGGLSYHEPSATLYIADTNNHCIKYVRLPQSLEADIQLDVQKLNIELESVDAIDSPREDLFDHNGRTVEKVNYDLVKLSAAEKSFSLKRKLPAKCKLTEQTESVFRVSTFSEDGSTAIGNPTNGVLKVSDTNPEELVIDIQVADQPATVKLTVVVEFLAFYCSESDKTCKRDCVVINQPVEIVA